MALITLAVSGYPSLRSLVLALERLNVVTGANGSGESSLYRSLRLLADVAQGQAIGSLAAEGGLRSTMWAGGSSYSTAMRLGRSLMQGNIGRGPVSLRLGFASEDYGYAIDLGLPIPGPGASREEASLFGDNAFRPQAFTMQLQETEASAVETNLERFQGLWRQVRFEGMGLSIKSTLMAQQMRS